MPGTHLPSQCSPCPRRCSYGPVITFCGFGADKKGPTRLPTFKGRQTKNLKVCLGQGKSWGRFSRPSRLSLKRLLVEPAGK